jgi:phage-related minor tail protein
LSKGRDIRGLTIEIGGDTTGLQNSLKNVNSQIKTTQAQLKDINNLLKLDPTNTELLQQKQKALADEIESTKEKLETLKTAEQQAQQQFAEGKISQEQYDALKREIIATEESLKSLENEAKNAPTQMQQSLDGLNAKINTTQTELKEIDKLLKLDPTNTELLQQKQRALSDEIGNTKEKLELLKNEEGEVQQKFQEGKVSQEQYDALKRTIIETEESLKSLENEVGSGSAKLAQISTEAGKIGENLTTAGEKMLPVTAAITGLGTAAVKTAADFDSSMSNVAAISGSSAEDMDKLRERAREMGAQTKFSAKEAGDAMGYMAMAGWNAQDMYNSLPGIMNLAAASGEDLATTSDIVTDAMTAFGLAADETTTIVKDGFSKEVDNATHFADVLAQASSSANTNVGMMGETFKYIAPVAGALGYSAEDAATAIGLMANSGIKASQAGTQLRSSLTNMIKPSKDVGDAMEKWGFYATESATSIDQAKIDKQILRVQKASLAADKAQQAYNDAVSKYGAESTEATNAAASLEIKQTELATANETLTQLQEGTTENVRLYNKALQNEDGSMKSLKETMDFLREAMGNMSEAEQTQAATAIFGKEAMSGMLAIINASDADYEKLIKNIDNCDGAAENMAETMQDNLSGQLTTLQSALQELAIAFGEILMPYIRKAAEVIQGFVEKLNGMSEGQKKVVATIALIVAAIGPLLIMVGKVATGISAITGLFSKMKTLTTITSIIGKLKGAFTALFGVIAANPVIAVIAAIVAALVLLYTKCEWFRDVVNAVVQKIVSFFTETIPQAWSTLMDFLSGVPEWWSGIWQQVSDFFMQIWNGIVNFFTVTIPQAWNSVVTFFAGVPAWWSGIWQQVSDFFANIWTTMMQNPVISGIVTTITTLWQNAVNTLQNIWQGLVTIAQGAWELLKNTILAPVILLIDLVTGNFDKLKTDASNIWTNIKDAAQTIWTGIKQVVSTLAKGLVTAVTTLFTGFRDTVSKIWDSASQAASKAWTAIKRFVVNNAKKLKESATEAIQNLKDRASEYWDNIRERTSETWQNVKETVIQYAGNMKDRAVDTFNSVVSGISGALSGVYSAVVNGFSSAISYITGLPGQAVRWGQDFVNGIANGIRSCIGNVTNAVSNVANTIRSWLHFSRPDEGPLHYYEEWMPDFMKGLATGIEKSQGLVADAMKDVQMDMQLDTSSMKPANNLNKTDITGITGMLAQLIQVMSAGQEIYFDNKEWAGKLAPAINTELGRIAKEAAYR